MRAALRLFSSVRDPVCEREWRGHIYREAIGAFYHARRRRHTSRILDRAAVGNGLVKARAGSVLWIAAAGNERNPEHVAGASLSLPGLRRNPTAEAVSVMS